MNDLLRGKLGFEGIIQTDWGLNHVVAAQNGADIVGGAGQREIPKLIAGLSEEELNAKVQKILVMKFQLGIFENPFVNPEAAALLLGSDEHKALAYEAARRSLTLVKYSDVPALADKTILIAGSLADDANALNSGWKVPQTDGQSILAALTDKHESIVYVGDDLSAIDVPEDAVIVAILGEKSGTHDPDWGYSTVAFPEEQIALLRSLKENGLPVVTVVLMGRPYCMEEIDALSDAVLIAYRPGVTEGANAVADALLGVNPINGTLPWQLPRAMEQVTAQREDNAKDIVDPMYDYGFGITLDSFGK
jgi:hypothetical protein